MRVLVTDGDTRPALAITRSLGRLGHEVFVAAERHPSLAAVSRYCAGRETYAHPHGISEAFIHAIADITARRRIDLLLPVTEVTTWLIAQGRQQLPGHCALSLPATASLRIANDKAQVLALARELDVPIPSTFAVGSVAEADSISTNLPYPVVIKPTRSRVRALSGWLSAGVSYAHDPADLSNKLASLPASVFPVLLQERIIGAGTGIFACYRDGQPIAFFSHRRLREKPPSGGVSVLCESAPLDTAAVDFSRKLLSRLAWHGVAMVEFKRNDRDGSLRLMEINGRFWGSLQLAVDAGVDFPALVAAIGSGAKVDPPQSYRLGVRSRWFLGDLDAMLVLLFRGQAWLGLPDGHPGTLRTLWDFLHCWRRDQRNEVLRLEDPRPGLLEAWRWLTNW